MNDRKGLIFNIVRGSFVDGYGIRTTIFLKGCPLRCIWCCNPEGQEAYPEIKFTLSKCNGCKRCIQVCPPKAINLDLKKNEDKIKINRELCTNCESCIDVCYTGALGVFGKYSTVDEIFDIVKKDEQFYHASGGGITIGGGEPSFQALFTYELITKCKEYNIHTAIDTCGYTLTKEGMKVLEEADLLLYDLKGIDPEEHLKNTGVNNEIILSNLKMLDAKGKPIIIRVPLIAGYTDSAKNIKDTAEILCKLKSVKRVDLMEYHEYGVIKYEQLGKKYRLKDTSLLTEERLNEIRDIFERYGLNVQFGG